MKNNSGFLAQELPKEEMDTLYNLLGKKQPSKSKSKILSFKIWKENKVVDHL